eukprot:1487629-Prymnesium_polylepis.1
MAGATRPHTPTRGTGVGRARPRVPRPSRKSKTSSHVACFATTRSLRQEEGGRGRACGCSARRRRASGGQHGDQQRGAAVEAAARPADQGAAARARGGGAARRPLRGGQAEARQELSRGRHRLRTAAGTSQGRFGDAAQRANAARPRAQLLMRLGDPAHPMGSETGAHPAGARNLRGKSSHEKGELEILYYTFSSPS